LQDKTFTAEQPRTQAFLERDFERDRLFSAQECLFPANQ
jgi:hypothetical protein